MSVDLENVHCRSNDENDISNDAVINIPCGEMQRDVVPNDNTSNTESPCATGATVSAGVCNALQENIAKLPWSNVFLVVVIIVVAAILALPLMCFYLPREDKLNVDLDPLSCSAQPYTGSMCLLELHDWQRCLPERQNDSDVFIPSDVDQQMREEQAQLLFTTGLPLLGASEDCVRESKSYFCLLLFGLCDGSGQNRLPSREECIDIQQNVCAAEIQRASEIELFAPLIQDCDLFRFNNPTCQNQSENQEETHINVTCSDQFYFEEKSQLCKPECGVWTQHSDTRARSFDAVFIISDVFSVFICSAIIVLSLHQRKRMFTFPTVLVLYQTMAILIVSALDLLRYNSTDDLLCSSKDLTESLKAENSTPLCEFLGGVTIYSLLMIFVMWLFQTVFLFWAVVYPLHYHTHNTHRNLKYIHLVVVAVSFVVPIIPIASIGASEGYGLNILSYYKCYSRGAEDTFYGFIVPVIIMVIAGTTLMIIIFWTIANAKNKYRKGGTFKQISMKTAEIKILISICYYFVLTVYNLTGASVALWRSKLFENEVIEHFACEALGNDAAKTCSKEGFDDFTYDAINNTFYYVVFSFIPLIYFIFLINVGTLKKYWNSTVTTKLATDRNTK